MLMREKHQLGLQRFQEGQVEQASLLFQAALAEHATAEGWNDWASAELACGRPAPAEAGYRRALQLDPSGHTAALNLGILYSRSRRWAEAIGWLERGIAAADEAERPIVRRLQAGCRRWLAAAQAQPAASPRHFLDHYRHRRLGEAFSDQTPVSVHDPGLAWLRPPSPSLLAYARNRQPWPFDAQPPNPDFLRHTTFLIAQAHRIGLTLEALARHWEPGREGSILDLGAFPFAIDIAIREYLGFPTPILATFNQPLAPEGRARLEKLDVTLLPTNLDPLVQPTAPLPGMTDYIQAPAASVQFVLFAHVIEHLYHPLGLLKEAHRTLQKGGKILLSTDNGFILHGLLNYLTLAEFVHENVEGTAAMTFTTWRGHVRFYSATDLRTLLEAAGFKVIETQFHEVLYNSFPDEYFRNPTRTIPRWRADLLTQFPQYRNEIIMVAEKP